MNLKFYLRFHTEFGQSLWISGNINELGNDDPAKVIAMNYLNEEFWEFSIELKRKDIQKKIRYKYFFKNEGGELLSEWGDDRIIDMFSKEINEIQLFDTWNHAGEYENAFFSAPFNNVLLKTRPLKDIASNDKNFTHVFKVKAPLLQKHEVVCLMGSSERLGDWSTINPVLLEKDGDWWTVKSDLSVCSFPLAYKYGVFNSKEKSFINYEAGNNRLLYNDAAKKKVSIVHDGFIHLPNDTWKGSGIAIPVFSLRSKNSFGVGEFADIKLLVDWARSTGLKLIQILPVNDTIATKSWMDSYPYAAISAFALHPLYINLAKVAGKQNAEKVSSLKKKQKQLNELAEVDYEEVIKFKLAVLKELYDLMGQECFASADYQSFFENNKHWLQPYAAFCFFRDKYGTSHFEEWRSNGIYSKPEFEKLYTPKPASFKEIGLYCFIQYHLHLHLKDATDYAHKNEIGVKGDIPI